MICHFGFRNICHKAKAAGTLLNADFLAGDIALAKVQATKTMEFCARESSQIFGGRAYLREGKGAMVERLYREVA